MAGLEGLTSIIYHEKQALGSMLCAQHALNSLLQGNYFTAPDLSDIARSLDTLEQSFDDGNPGTSSMNMDDTGFFSVQVLENALNVWGLTLVRWRSEDMRPYQDQPDTQQAFILHQQQHWFTLRRFGSSQPTSDSPGHWFNLNSFLEAPEWVGRLYLGMVLQQAEKEGYSVFAVVPIDPTALPTQTLPHAEADDVAASLPEPSSSASTRLNMSRTPARSLASTSRNTALEGFEEEDMELQAALQASLLAGDAVDFVLPPSLPLPTLSSPPVRGLGYNEPPSSLATASNMTSEGDTDPVAASMARNRAIIERMRRQQEMALRESREEEVARFHHGGRPALQGFPVGYSRIGASASGAGDDNELSHNSQVQTPTESHITNEADEADEDDMDSDDPDYVPPLFVPASPPAQLSHGPQLYDDDDAELQAALRASMEGVPEGFVVPDFGPTDPPSHTTLAAAQPSRTLRSEDEMPEADTSLASVSSVEEPEEQLSVDEMRRRRLARFGG